MPRDPADRRSRPRAGLTRQQILDAAIEFVDEHGLAALSTRKLGAKLGVEGMTLYHYVPSKAALLDGMVERMLDRSLRGLPTTPDTPWPDAVRAMAHGLHAALLEHPAMLPLIATRPVATPAAIQILEDGLAQLRAQGVALARAMDILNAVTMFVIGHTLAEAADTPGHEDAATAPAPVVDPEQFPNFAEAIRTGAGLDFDSRFTSVLDILLAGFATN
jgi:TetR/AcrR family transcriptional regulator, tetracycline repressor protein